MVWTALEGIEKKYIKKCDIVRMNADDNAVTAKKYHVGTTPSFIFFKKGVAIEKVIGMMDPRDIRLRINQLASI